MNLNDKVKFLCFKMCEYLEEIPEEDTGVAQMGKFEGQNFIQKNWINYEQMIRQWLVQEAFNRVRSEYWNEEKFKEAEAENARELINKTA